MTKQQIIEQYPAICVWLKIDYDITRNGLLHQDGEVINFLHKCHQLQWVEDRLIELGYGIEYTYLMIANEWDAKIFDCYLHDVCSACNKSKSHALLEAVIELIEKENERKTEREQWFLNRIGKRIFRNNNGCSCGVCKNVNDNGLIVEDEFHATHLLENELCYNADGFRLRYFDTKEEVNEFIELINKENGNLFKEHNG